MTLLCAVLAVGFAGAAGLFWWEVHEKHRLRLEHLRSLGVENRLGLPGFGGDSQGGNASFPDRVIEALLESSASTRRRQPLVTWLSSRCASAKLEERMRVAGLLGAANAEGYAELSLKMCACGGAAGLLVGALFSIEFCLLMGCVGGVLGWRSVRSSIDARVRKRVDEMERHLSEMLDVMALGMRSGLSFDRSLALYCERFSNSLSQSFALAQQQWSHGLQSRDEALRQLAHSYDSLLLGRVVENIIRSLRFGSSLAESLEIASAQARADFRTKKQEQVAKAPVKMLIPTGTLILPAMLLLVLGPVMLELMGGF